MVVNRERQRERERERERKRGMQYDIGNLVITAHGV